MRYRVQIGVGLAHDMEKLIAASVADARALFPNQAHAIKRLSKIAHRRWLEYASGARVLPNGKKIQAVSGQYLSSINIEESGELAYVIYSDDPKAQWIEEGFPAFDMKAALMTSHKVRLSKTGKRYLIVPFRHKTPQSLGVVMPAQAEAFWLSPARKSSVISGHYLENSVQDGQTKVTRRTYQWGDRTTRRDVENMGLDPDEKLGSRLVGMVRMQNDEDRGGQHMTFRVMSESSHGWLMPAREGAWAAKASYGWVQQNYEAVMRVALQEDVRALGGRLT